MTITAAASKYTFGDAAVPARRGGQQSGRDDGHQAVEERGARAQGDQREHVEAAVDDRAPAAHEERPAAPEDDRGGEQELDASSSRGGTACAMGLPGSISPIATASSGAVSNALQRKRRAMSTSSGFSGSCAETVRGSSAMPQMGQSPGRVADDLGVHRAGPAGLGARRGRRLGTGPARLEPRLAARGAEVDRRALVVAPMDGPRGVHAHPADRVYELGRRRWRGLLAPRRRVVKNTRFDEPPRQPADPAAALAGPHRHRLQPPRRRHRPARRPHRARDARWAGWPSATW